MFNRLLHITSVDTWEEARAIGLYSPTSLEQAGFIHFSAPDQVLNVANALYRGRQDLVLLVVDARRLTSTLKWEAPVHPAGVEQLPHEDAQPFPHLYGPLNLDAVIRVIDFRPEADGSFILPEV